MKNCILFLLLLFSLSVNSQTERITYFHSHVDIDTSGVFTITETIKVIADGKDIQRGIFRKLPTERKEVNGNYVPIGYRVISIYNNNKVETFHTEENRNFFTIYIGSRERYLSPGEYTYQIKYETYGQLGFYENYDEINWNVTGNEWAFPIDTAIGTVNLPTGTTAIQVSCYVGYYGSTSQDCKKEYKSDIRFEAYNLKAQEGLTMAVGFTKGVVIPPAPPSFFEKNKMNFLYGGMTILLLLYYFFTWKKFGIDPEKPTVYPQFEPPEGISPAGVASFYNDKISESYFSTTIINLAVKGYLKIEHSGSRMLTNKFILIKLKESIGDDLLPEEVEVFRDLFRLRHRVRIDGSYEPNIRHTIQEFRANLFKNYGKVIEQGRNYRFLIFPILLMIFTIVFIFSISAYTREDIMLQDFLFSALFILLPVSFFLIIKIKSLVRLLKNNTLARYIGIVLVAVGLYALLNVLNPNLYLVAIFLLISFTSLILYRYLIEQPSQEKLEIQSHVEGFRMYMMAAEAEMIKQFNPPKMSPERFEELLPFAIALNVEDIWGETFNKYLLETGQDYNQYWYSGNIHSIGSIRNINDTLANTVYSSSVEPSASGGGSFGSGSGGGGFSGGGGGGGGGGGW